MFPFLIYINFLQPNYVVNNTMAELKMITRWSYLIQLFDMLSKYMTVNWAYEINFLVSTKKPSWEVPPGKFNTYFKKVDIISQRQRGKNKTWDISLFRLTFFCLFYYYNRKVWFLNPHSGIWCHFWNSCLSWFPEDQK